MSISPSDAGTVAAPDTATVLDKEELRLTVAGVLDIEAADLTDEANFTDDLEVDSLMALEVVVARTFPLAEVAAATALVADGHAGGKVVLLP